jgi:hypothetical protein
MEAKTKRSELMERRRVLYVKVSKIGDYDINDFSEFSISTLNPDTPDSTYILSHIKNCAKITIRNPFLTINGINKCGHTGNFTLSKIVNFANKNGLTIELEDASTIADYDIELSLLKILQTGHTWYGNHGFKNGSEDHQDRIQRYINSPYKNSTIRETAIELGERLKGGDTSVIDEIKYLCEELSYFLDANHIYNNPSHTKGGKSRKTKHGKR